MKQRILEIIVTALCAIGMATILAIATILIVLSAGCVVKPAPVVTPQPVPPDPAYVAAVERDCRSLYASELKREIDPVGLNGCRARGLSGEANWQEAVRDFLRTTDEYAALQAAMVPPVTDKTTFIRTYQANFGGIKLPGCGLHLDNLFDPFLLIKWVEDRDCFERMMQAHMDRGDNVVIVDPRSGYHGHNDVDLWHQPEAFAAFLQDIRRHVNSRGEHIRTQVFFAGDGHIDDMRAPGALDHWRRDVDAIAAVAEPAVDSTVPCWECRHQNDYVSARIYYDMLAHLAVRFPAATHGVHLIQNSSSPSSWRCDPQIPGSCASPSDGPDASDADDPARGNEIGAWVWMRERGLVDVFYYQFEAGDEYANLDAYPSDPENGGQKGAARRWWEIVVRLADDPWANATMRQSHPNGDHFGWPVQVPVIAFEFIYDFYWNRGPDEALQIKRCQHFLALGGWGCGSASYRRAN